MLRSWFFLFLWSPSMITDNICQPDARSAPKTREVRAVYRRHTFFLGSKVTQFWVTDSGGCLSRMPPRIAKKQHNNIITVFFYVTDGSQECHKNKNKLIFTKTKLDRSP